jgi:hypothetical protein
MNHDNGNITQRAHVFRSRRPDLEYFDALPPEARHALANAVFDWASGWFWQAWKRRRRGCETGSDIANRVREWDAQQIDEDRRA